MLNLFPDAEQRERALDPHQSFIVQAPAGSGKTELLTQRYLALLAHVDKFPEEIIAITFTRKAASEMRARIINALTLASSQEPPQTNHELKTWNLARAALQRDQLLDWQLLANPNRLRIQTIDSLCATITAQMPIITHFGLQPKISDDMQYLYQQAVREILATLENNLPWTDALTTLLLHLDNDHSKAERLLVDMLARRDQWLSHIVGNNPRELLEQALAAIIKEQLLTLRNSLCKISVEELLTLIRFAAENLARNNPASTITFCNNLVELPEASIENLPIWLAIANFLLTKEKQWRKKITINEGFPPASHATEDNIKQYYQEMKLRMNLLLGQLIENEELRLELESTLDLPPPCYNDSQWQIIEALVTLLPVLVAQLNVLFKELGVVDYTEITLRAVAALGTFESPSDLALSLDYQISHLLVDEFQDTSVTQFRLLEQLTAGWQVDDRRTIFLVGDPMQSIYRFRKAEVGLFLQAKQFGIGNKILEPLDLMVNFRSCTAIIDWFNKTFAQIFPRKDDLSTGAIHFSRSSAFVKGENYTPAINIIPCILGNSQKEANHIINIITQTKALRPDSSIAILVQARSHLLHILPILKKEGISYRAVEIESLYHRSVIQDLLSLTKALLHLGDRIAWLGILRAPWCGLLLADLLTISENEQPNTLWHHLQNFQLLPLTEDGKQRISRILPVLLNSLENTHRSSLAFLIESTWLALGGPACVENDNDLSDAQAFFELLTSIENKEHKVDLNLLERRLENLSATAMIHENAIEVMTIHKAKGLEFDTVIIPGLEKQSRNDSHQLLLWQERPTPSGTNELILAPIKKIETDPIYEYLRRQENKKARNELIRLLYVATTRAKNCLYLLGTIEKDENNQIKPPSSHSLLDLLWPEINELFQQEKTGLVNIEKNNDLSSHFLTRLTSNWVHPLLAAGLENNRAIDSEYLSQKKFTWQYDTAKFIGTAIHRMLYHMSKSMRSWDIIKIKKHRPHIEYILINLGIPNQQLSNASEMVEKALINIKSDLRAQWILSADHQQAESEIAYTTVIDDEVTQVVIDRTFIENNTRWIIDYKTSQSQDEDFEGFLADEQKKYYKQLEQYAKILRLKEDYPIRLGLYFPLLKAWREWEFEE